MIDSKNSFTEKKSYQATYEEMSKIAYSIGSQGPPGTLGVKGSSEKISPLKPYLEIGPITIYKHHKDDALIEDENRTIHCSREIGQCPSGFKPSSKGCPKGHPHLGPTVGKYISITPNELKLINEATRDEIVAFYSNQLNEIFSDYNSQKDLLYLLNIFMISIIDSLLPDKSEGEFLS
jgi:hypothetical protein